MARTWLVVAAVVAVAVGLAAWAAAVRGDDHERPADPPAALPAQPVGSAVSRPRPHADPRPARAPGPLPGFLLIADRGNDRMLLVDGAHHVLWRYPSRGAAPPFPFRYDDDAFFAPDYRSIITNEEDQDTIEVLSFPGGRVLWHYGHVDVAGSAPGYLHGPDDAYLLPGGVRSVADIRNCRVLFISRASRILRQLGTTGVCGHDPPRLLGSPNGDTPLPHGGTLVTEISGSWVDAFDRHGRMRWSFQAPATYPSDAQLVLGGDVLLADYARPGQVLILTRQGHVVWRYGPSSGAGMLDHPSLALMLPNGLIAVNDDYRHRVVLISRRSRRIVWQYGHTDRAGTAPGSLNVPDGLDFLPVAVAAGRPSIAHVVARSLRR